MSIKSHVPIKHFVLGILFVVTNRLDTLLDRELSEFGITSKQWFLSIVIGNAFGKPPTMKEAAKQMGCSHQNVKQVALKLEEKGLLKMEKDENDQRVTRMRLTQKSTEFWSDISPKDYEFMDNVFQGIGEDDMETTKAVLVQVLENLEKMDERK
ncbi:MAG: MarR family transcriptional regulator [Eubacteriales bacterium]